MTKYVDMCAIIVFLYFLFILQQGSPLRSTSPPPPPVESKKETTTPTVPIEQIVHLVPVQNPDGTVQCMFISLGDNDELKIAETESKYTVMFSISYIM